MTDKEKLLEIINDSYIYYSIGEVKLELLLEELQKQFPKIKEYIYKGGE